MADHAGYTLAYGVTFGRILKKLKGRDMVLLRELDRSIVKILREPYLGKPLGNVLRNHRRIHVAGSFVLIYEIRGQEVRLIDFDHHDRVYRKYS
ncbi:MAG: type II toxin-antitoxin system RelE/ParE family toxin [Patescibacteria group bacterium]